MNEELKVAVRVEAGNATKKMKQFQQTTKGTGKTATKTSGEIGSMVSSFIGVGTAIATVTKTYQKFTELAKESIKLAGIQEKAEKKLESIVRATGRAAGFSATELKNVASGLQSVTTFGDEAIIELQSLLLTFKGIQGEAFERTTELALDLSSAFGQDLKSSALQLGKALEDPKRGLTALRRIGVSFTEDQEEMIKGLVDAGETAEAQGIILDTLEGQVGGVAEAMADTASGAMEQFKNASGDVKEEIGFLLQDAMHPWLKSLTDIKSEQAGFLKAQREFKQVMSEDFMKEAVDNVYLMEEALGATQAEIKALQKRTESGYWSALRKVGEDLGIQSELQEKINELKETETVMQERIAEMQEKTSDNVKDQVDYNKELVEYWKKVDPEFAKRLEQQEKDEKIINRKELAHERIKEQLKLAREEMELMEAVGGNFNYEAEKRKIVLKEINELIEEGYQVHYKNKYTWIQEIIDLYDIEIKKSKEVNEGVEQAADNFNVLADNTYNATQRMEELLGATSRFETTANAIARAKYFRAIKAEVDEGTEAALEFVDVLEFASSSYGLLSGVANQYYENELTNLEKNSEEYKKIKREQFRTTKALKIAEATINAASAVLALWADPTLPVWAKVGMSAVISGITATQIGLIADQEMPAFAQGGDFVTSGPQTIRVGDNPGGRERVSVTPLSSPNVAGPGGGVTIAINAPVYGVNDLYYKLKSAGNTLSRRGRG